MTALPNKLSALLRIAVEDAQKCEADPRYLLRMGDWHVPSDSTLRCEVCMAGAVMAQRFGAEPIASFAPTDYDDATAEAFWAIDAMRRGYFDSAAEEINLRLTEEQQDALDDMSAGFGIDVTKGRADWPAYIKAADELEAIGL